MPASPSRSRHAKISVWLLLVAVLTLGGSLFFGSKPAPIQLNDLAAGAAVTSQTQSVSTAVDPSSGSVGSVAQVAASLPSGTQLLAESGSSGCQFKHAKTGADMCGDVSTLPAWRWSGSPALDNEDGGLLGFIKNVVSGVSQLLFLVAGLVWSLLLWILRFGFSADLVTMGAKAINSGIAAVGKLIGYVVAAVAVWAAVSVFRLFFSGQVIRAGKTAFRYVILLAMVFGLVTMADNAQQAAGSDPAQQSKNIANYKGSVPWIAKTVSNAVTEIPASALQVAKLSDWASNNKAKASDAQGPAPTCAAYIAALHDIYGSGSDHNAALTAVSQFWEQTFYTSWQAAAFGPATSYTSSKDPNVTVNVDLPGRSMCRWAELNAETNPDDQLTVAKYAWDKYEAGTVDGASNPWKSASSVIFTGENDDKSTDKDRRRAMTAWSACAFNGSSWFTHDAWYGAWLDDNLTLSDASADHFEGQEKQCTAAMTKGDLNIDGDPDSFDIFNGKYGAALKFSSTTDPAQEVAFKNHMAAAKRWTRAFYADNFGERMLYGLFAIVVALMAFYIFGFMAVGLLGAQMMLVALLVCLPVTVCLVAFESDAGRKMLKLTGTTLVSKGILTAAIVLMVAITQVVQAISGTVFDTGGFGGGFVTTILTSLSPIAAAFAVRILLKNAGLGDIFSPTGAMSFVTAAAAGQAGTSDPIGNKLSGSKIGQKLDENAKLSDAARLGGRLGRAGFLSTRKAGREKLRRERDERRKQRELDRLERLRNETDDAESGSRREEELREWASQNGIDVDTLGLGRVGRFLASRSDSDTSNIDPATGMAATYDPNASDVDLDALPAITPDEVAKSAQDLADADTDRRMFMTNLAGEPEAAAMARYSAVERLVDGVNGMRYTDGFEGFHTEVERAAYATAFAQTNGVGVEDIIVGDNGLMMVAPMTRDDAKARLEVGQLERQWQHFLPDEVKVRLAGEDDTDYVTRLHVEGLERGLLTHDGKPISVFAKLGIDLDGSDMRELAEEWASRALEGAAALNFDTLRFDSPDSAATARMVLVAKAVAKDQRVSADAKRRALAAEVAAAVREAQSAIANDGDRTRLAVEAMSDAASTFATALEELRTLSATGAEHEAVVAADAAVSRAREALDANQRLLAQSVWESRQNVLNAATALRTENVTALPGGNRAIVAGVTAALEANKAQIEQLNALADAVRLGHSGALRALNEALDEEVAALEMSHRALSDRVTDAETVRLKDEYDTAVRVARSGASTKSRLTVADVVGAAEPFPR